MFAIEIRRNETDNVRLIHLMPILMSICKELKEISGRKGATGIDKTD